MYLGRKRVKFLCFLGFIGLLLFHSSLKFFFSPTAEDPCEILEKETPKIKNSSLPKVIHKPWKDNGPLPERIDRWFQTWRKVFPNHEIIIWTDDKAKELIENEFPWFLPSYNALKKSIMKIDSVRPFVLYKYGGLFVDMDYEVLEDFWDRLPDDMPAFVQSYWVGYEDLQNSFMSSPPNHPFWKYTWQVMEERIATGSQDEIWVTACTMISAAIELYPGPVKILPCQNWQRLSIGEQTIKHRLWRKFANMMGLFRECGNVDDTRCELVIHRSMTSWNP